MSYQVQYRQSTAAAWTSANPTLAQGELGVETDTGQFKIGTGTTPWTSLAYAGATGPAQTRQVRSLGDGSDGDVTISSGVVNLTSDKFYNNLTMSGSGQLQTHGFRVFVKGILDLTAATVGAINVNGANGGNASGATGGTAGAAQVAAAIGVGASGTSGANGVVGIGTQSTATVNVIGNGGSSNSCGAGGAGTSGAGGAAVGAGNTINSLISDRWETNFTRGILLLGGASGGRGGSSGAGDGANQGGGGGAGGAGGGLLALYVNVLVKGPNTPAGAIQALGGNGGNGSTPGVGVIGGGGGGAGGGGGWIYLAYNTLVGPVITNLVQAGGGVGGNGGNGATVAAAGNGGNGGYGGRINTVNIPSPTLGIAVYGANTLQILPEVTAVQAPSATGPGAGSLGSPTNLNF